MPAPSTLKLEYCSELAKRRKLKVLFTSMLKRATVCSL